MDGGFIIGLRSIFALEGAGIASALRSDGRWKRETLWQFVRFNALVTVPMLSDETQSEMTSVKAALLSLAMLAAIGLWGIGIYSADAANNHNAVDGYGVTTSLR